MAEPHDPLAAFAALERRYDGAIPEAERRVARFGSAAAERLVAEGQAAFFEALALGQIAIIRRRRRDGSFYPALTDYLAFYRRSWQRWRRVAQQLREAAEPSPAPRLAAE